MDTTPENPDIQALKSLLKIFSENINDVIFSVDSGGLFTYISPAIERLTHFQAQEVIGQPFSRFVHPQDLPELMASFEHTLAGDLAPLEFRIRTKNGGTLYVRTSSRPLFQQNQLIGLTGVMVDITASKMAEKELRQAHNELEQRVVERTSDLAQANRMLSMLTECNQALMRASDEQALLQEICRLIVDQGGYHMAWVGFAEQDPARTVRPVAQAGFEAGYLSAANITWADSERGRGPTGTAIRTGKPCIVRDIHSEPKFAPWREEAARCGYASSITLPLLNGDRAFGGLNIFSAKPDAFAEKEVNLLMELAGDLAFGITSLRERTARKLAEEQLQSLADLQSAILINAASMIISTDRDGIITTFNPAAEKALGYTASECIGKLTPMAFHDPNEIAERARILSEELNLKLEPGFEALVARARLNLPNEGEWTHVRKDGFRFPVLLLITALRNSQGEIIGFLGIANDLTSYKGATEALSWANLRLDKALKFNRALLSAIPTPVFYKDREGRYLGCNRAFSEFMGVTPEEITGKTVFELWPSEHAIVYHEKDLELMRNAAHQVYEFRVRDKYGVDHPVIYAKDVFRDENDQVAGIVGAFLNITERKQAEDIREALYAISQAVLSSEKLSDLYQSIHHNLRGLMPAENFFIALYDPFTHLLTYPYFENQFEPAPGVDIAGNGLAGYVLRTGKSLLASPEVLAAMIKSGDIELSGKPAIDWIGVPLKVEGRTIGVMAAQTYTEHVRYGKKEMSIMELVSSQVALVIERKRSFEEIQRHLQRLNALRSIDLALTSSFNIKLNLDVLLQQVLIQLSVDAADILLLDPITLTLEYAAGLGFRTRGTEGAQIRLGVSYAGKVALDRRAIQLNYPEPNQASPQFFALWAEEGFHAYYAVPLIIKGQVKGVLEIFNRTPLTIQPDWLDFLETLAGQAAIGIENSQLFDHLQRSNVDLTMAYDATIEGWSKALDLRDNDTMGHTLRVTEMTLQLAQAVGVPDQEKIHIRHGALLHDIGKMGIPDAILLKAEGLTEEEWKVMRRHPIYAYEMLSPIAYLRPALDIPYCHHEKWDGSGYPRGLKGEQIPLSARVFAVIDVWDALNTDRPYRKAWERADTLEYIRSQAGAHFDPKIVEVFLATLDKE